MPRLCVTLILSVLVSSCNLPPYNPNSVRHLVPVGSSLRLAQPIEIPAGKSYVYIAGGKIMPFQNYNTVDIYKPYCEFTLSEVADKPRLIQPDRFVITKIVEWENYYGMRSGTLYARAGGSSVDIRTGAQIRMSIGTWDDGGPSTIMYATILSLHSGNQPQVKELVCGHWEEAGKVEAITLDQLKSALGQLIVLEK